MRKRYTGRGSYRKASRKERRQRQAGKGREIPLVPDAEEMVAMLQDSLTDFATEVGLKVARLQLEDEVEQRCGPWYERLPERTVTRYGRQPGVVVSRTPENCLVPCACQPGPLSRLQHQAIAEKSEQ